MWIILRSGLFLVSGLVTRIRIRFGNKDKVRLSAGVIVSVGGRIWDNASVSVNVWVRGRDTYKEDKSHFSTTVSTVTIKNRFV